MSKIIEIQLNTFLWFDNKLNAYLLPLKTEIRKKFKLENGFKKS